jgi:hypothetical protein
VVQAVLRELPEDFTKRLEGNLIMVTDLPGLEIVAEGVDPRTPLLLDELSSQDSQDAGEAHRRLFVYQRNIERLIRHPLELQQDILEILQRELEAHFKRPEGASGNPRLTPDH